MTVRTSKPALNLREKLSELDKPSGIAGQDILKADTPQEVFNYIGAGRRNLIINGAMQVAQRGTSFTNPNAVYTLDRFQARAGTSGALTVSQETMPYGQTDVPNIQNYVRCDQTTARTGAYQLLWQKVEDVTRFDNTTVTFSFYAKCDVAKQIELTTYQDFGTSGSSDVVVDNTVFNIETSWKRFEVTMHCPSISGKTINSGSYLLIEFRDETLGTYTLDITGIQLEYGKVATPFEHRSYGEELALCQRYYAKSFSDTITPSNGSTSATFSTSDGATAGYTTNNSRSASETFPTNMRVKPALTIYGNSSGYGKYYKIDGTGGWSSQAPYIGNRSTRGFNYSQNVSGATGYFIEFHWTADAEL